MNSSSLHPLLNSTASTSTPILETTTTFLINVTAKFENAVAAVSSSSISPSNTTSKDEGIIIPQIFNIFERHPWLLYVFLAVILIIVISVIVAIVCCILHNKKKVIRRGSSQAIFDYDQQTSGCFPCIRSSKTEEINNRLARQNSASNMSPYGRNGPLPPLRGPFPPHRPETSPQPSTLGMHITSVKGIPEIHINPENSRPLPPIRPKTTAASTTQQ